jgi:diadenosine tetraphosphate (Ap4A) HIT family hydrolase
MSESCPFCQRVEGGAVERATLLAASFPDAFPVAAGHTLVVPRRHVASYFELLPEEVAALWALVGEVQSVLAARLAPDGWNVGVNIGAAGGQTVDHVHIHVIPRFRGDVVDPRGGVRWILPEHAPWWKHTKGG